jgi:hypothetical protein
MAVEIEPSRQQFVSFVALRQQQRGSLSKWRLTWKCVVSRGVLLNFTMRINVDPLTFDGGH